MPEGVDPLSRPTAAWLETPEGEIIALEGSVTFGRSAGNTVVLDHEGVSRNHATIHCGGPTEYWLIDLGSCNGTILNGQCISKPTRLRQHDIVEVAGHKFHFVCPEANEPSIAARSGTLPMRRTVENKYWILIADIRDFTGLSQQLSGAKLLEFVERWINECKPVVEDNGARFVKFLGDGFFAAMPDGPGTDVRMATIVRGLAALNARNNPAFRIVVHDGIVAVGTAPLLNEESFIGAEVNFAFRMEKVTDSTGSAILVSEPAAVRLRNRLTLVELPAQKMKGFADEYRFFGVQFPE